MTRETKTPKPTATPDPDEAAFLAAYDAAEFPHPSVTVDVAPMTTLGDALYVFLVRRADHPAKGKWALAGGFVGMKESLDAAAERVLATKAGLSGIFLEQLYTFGEVDRDPRTRVITVGYYALVDDARLVRAATDKRDTIVARLEVPWEDESGGPVRAIDISGRELPLAFDHAEILGLVVKRLRGKLAYVPIGFQLLPKRFTLRQLQEVHEAVLGRKLNKDSFRRTVLASGLVAATGEMEKDVPYRPAELYRYVKAGRGS
jgi:8-oxo-dGTP diphosphatase